MTTAVVVLSDIHYFERAKRTIDEIRDSRLGDWQKDLIFISVDFDLEQEFIDKYSIIEKKFPRVDISGLMSKLSTTGYSKSDDREFNKTVQWEKLHIFDPWFKKWNKIIYFDVGFRIYDKVEYLEYIDCSGSIVAPNDSGYDDDRGGKGTNTKILDLFEGNNFPEDLKLFLSEFDEDSVKKEFFCNCIFVFDTSIIEKISETEMLEYINRYPLWRSNEMSFMNFYFILKNNIYKELPSRNINGKYLYAWSEYQIPNTNWTDYCYVKYSKEYMNPVV
jgi:hypothetical protein